MTVIALVSMKGGVGKTSVALGLASAGWQRSASVLLVDADPLANATGVLDARDPASPPGPGPWPSRWGPAIEFADAGMIGPHLARAPHDLVLIDSPPALGEVTMAALEVADVAVIVTEPGFFALQGAYRPLEAIASLRRSRNARLTTPMILLNRLRSTLVEHADCDLSLRAAYGQLVHATAIPERFAVQQSQALRVPIHAWDSPAGRELGQVYDLLFTHLAAPPAQP